MYSGVFTDKNGNIVRPNFIMQLQGPCIQVEILLTNKDIDYNTNNNLPIPSPVLGKALLDTGASHSGVDQKIIDQFKLQPIGEQMTGTVAGQTKFKAYPLRIKVGEEPTMKEHYLDFELPRVCGLDLTNQYFMGEPVIAIIGRDILTNCIFIYNGMQGMYTLSF